MIATCLRVDPVVFRHVMQNDDESRLPLVGFLHELPISDEPRLRLVAFIHLLQVPGGWPVVRAPLTLSGPTGSAAMGTDPATRWFQAKGLAGA